MSFSLILQYWYIFLSLCDSEKKHIYVAICSFSESSQFCFFLSNIVEFEIYLSRYIPIIYKGTILYQDNINDTGNVSNGYLYGFVTIVGNLSFYIPWFERTTSCENKCLCALYTLKLTNPNIKNFLLLENICNFIASFSLLRLLNA